MSDTSYEVREYRLVLGYNAVMMPEGATVLTAQARGGDILLYALVRPGRDVTREISVFRSGVPFLGHPGAYVATVQNGQYVYHVFGRTL